MFGSEGGKQESLDLVALLGEFSWSHSFRFSQVINYIHVSILLGSFFLIKTQNYWGQALLFYFKSDLVIESPTRRGVGVLVASVR